MRVLVCGGQGFIGDHLVKALSQDHSVIRADIKPPRLIDLRDPNLVKILWRTHGPFDEVYQLAADMGGAGFVFTGDNDAAIMHNSALINLNILEACREQGSRPKIFFSSSACVYPPLYEGLFADTTDFAEYMAYPAQPDSNYGWEKLFSERMYLAYHRNYGLDVRIARFHNIYGPGGTWKGGREKAPAAICRKVAEAPDGGTIEIWGDGDQARSFLYIDACIEGIRRLMDSTTILPLNIGSSRSITIADLVDMVVGFSGKRLTVNCVPGPVGVHARNSDNDLIRAVLGWEPEYDLETGMRTLYDWIKREIESCSLVTRG